MNIQKISVPEQFVISVEYTNAFVSDIPKILPQAFGSLGAYIASKGIKLDKPPFVIYRGVDVTGKETPFSFSFEVVFPLDKELDTHGDVKGYYMPYMELATTVYRGPYSQSAPVYQALVKWVEENGYKYEECAWETYLSGPEVPEKESITIISIPITK
ncbi:effector-binding domain-containing protein [Elusimicrobium posterum]|uniref:GyrI-like domain-containing protein n=1 Tax=Elusimicrobium posterum TaxID=3116653 RepID=UPI003C72FE20